MRLKIWMPNETIKHQTKVKENEEVLTMLLFLLLLSFVQGGSIPAGPLPPKILTQTTGGRGHILKKLPNSLR